MTLKLLFLWFERYYIQKQRERERMVLVKCASASCLKRRFAFCWTTRGSCFQIRKSGRIMMLRLSCSLKDMEWLAVRNQVLQVLLVQEVNSLLAFFRLAKPANLMKIAPPVSTDLSPTWKGARKTLRLGRKRWRNHGKKMERWSFCWSFLWISWLRKHHSDYTGIPLSRSRWSTVPPEDRGEKHAEEKTLDMFHTCLILMPWTM